MADSRALDPPGVPDPSLAQPGSLSAAPAGPGPLPTPAASDTAADGPLTLETSLLGPLTLATGAARAAELEELSRRAAVYATRARGDGTRRAYRAAWRQYETWCYSLGREPLAADPDTIAMYVVRLADQDRAVSTIRVALAAIRTAHLLAGRAIDLRHPRLAMVVEGVTRSKGVRPRRKAAPALPGLLRRMLAACQAGPAREATVAREAGPACEASVAGAARAAIVARDQAMLLLGFGAALRRSELVGLTLGDLETVPGRGLLVTIGRSKTDQHGQGQRVAVCANPTDPTVCPAAAVDAWLSHRRTAPDLGWTASAVARADRPLFCAVTKAGTVTGTKLSDKAVVRLIKQAAADAGLDPASFSGHSLRRGLLSAGGANRAALADLMRQSRHRSVASVLGYVEAEDLWHNNVTAGVFGEPRSRPERRESDSDGTS